MYNSAGSFKVERFRNSYSNHDAQFDITDLGKQAIRKRINVYIISF